jgi:carbonic anhydrase
MKKMKEVTTLKLFAVGLLLATAPLSAEVLTKEKQGDLTPDEVLADLMEGNKRFAGGRVTIHENVLEEVRATATGQYPQAIILSCVDSRVPVELVFDQDIGDIFVARVAGNVENVDILGSMEFATKVAGSKLVMVLGHEGCGAVKGACDHVKMGNLTELLDKIQPAVTVVSPDFAEAERTSSNKKFVDKVIQKNVQITVADIRKRSPILAELEEKGAVKIVGAIYDLDSGKVTVLD